MKAHFRKGMPLLPKRRDQRVAQGLPGKDPQGCFRAIRQGAAHMAERHESVSFKGAAGASSGAEFMLELLDKIAVFTRIFEHIGS
ncbi:hypothetical protein ACFSLT_26740 [Novosphingobium resinovorum]